MTDTVEPGESGRATATGRTATGRGTATGRASTGRGIGTGTGRVFGAALRGFAGAVALVGGLTWILLNLHAPALVRDMAVGLVLTAGGLVLLMPHRVPLPARFTALTAGTTAVLGAAAGLVARRGQEGGMFGYVEARGWPYEWLARGATADDPRTARALAEQAGWQVDAVNVAANLVFWGLIGLLLAAALRKPRPRP
ncbi:hypothetical protein Asp14428_55410 [Actinoplanes sp. NBRC 14428]|nr:hypothetical protein Asp14428_55410 [Actinoplanes sp. NBRC 14428]